MIKHLRVADSKAQETKIFLEKSKALNELYLPILFNEAIRLFQSDKKHKFITESNQDFLEETGVIKHFKYK